MDKEAGLPELFLRTKLIVWDESSAVMRYHFEALDHCLRDLMRVRGYVAKSKLPFGGIVVVAGGDFRQTLPIVQHVQSVADIVGVTIKLSLHRGLLDVAPGCGQSLCGLGDSSGRTGDNKP